MPDYAAYRGVKEKEVVVSGENLLRAQEPTVYKMHPEGASFSIPGKEIIVPGGGPIDAEGKYQVIEKYDPDPDFGGWYAVATPVQKTAA